MFHEEDEEDGNLGKILSSQERKQLAIEVIQLLHKHKVTNTADLLDFGLNNLISIVGNIILATPKEKQVQTMFLMQRLVLKILDQGIQEVFSTILNKTGKGIEASAVNAVTGETKTIDLGKFPSSSEEAAKLFSDEKETSPEFSSEELQEAEKITKDFLEELSKKGKLN